MGFEIPEKSHLCLLTPDSTLIGAAHSAESDLVVIRQTFPRRIFRKIGGRRLESFRDRIFQILTYRDTAGKLGPLLLSLFLWGACQNRSRTGGPGLQPPSIKEWICALYSAATKRGNETIWSLDAIKKGRG